MASRTRAPAAILTLGPMLTLGPSYRTRPRWQKDDQHPQALPRQTQTAPGARLCGRVHLRGRVNHHVPGNRWPVACAYAHALRGASAMWQEEAEGQTGNTQWQAQANTCRLGQAGRLVLPIAGQVVAIGVDGGSCRACRRRVAASATKAGHPACASGEPNPPSSAGTRRYCICTRRGCHGWSGWAQCPSPA